MRANQATAAGAVGRELVGVSILGTRVLRIEDPRFLTTGGVYTEDVVDDRLTGACHVFFVRSPIAHARIGGIDVSGALSAPGVIAAFTAADLADLPDIGPMMAGLTNERMRHRLLATDVVRFVGEPVAVVVTDDPYQGEDAMELVDADYDPLPPVIWPTRPPATSCCSPTPAPTSPRPSATPPNSRLTCSTAATWSSAARSSTSGSRPRRWRPAPPLRPGATTAG